MKVGNINKIIALIFYDQVTATTVFVSWITEIGAYESIKQAQMQNFSLSINFITLAKHVASFITGHGLAWSQ